MGQDSQGVVARLRGSSAQDALEESDVNKLVLEHLLEAAASVCAEAGSGESRVVEHGQTLGVEVDLQVLKVESEREDLEICTDMLR